MHKYSNVDIISLDDQQFKNSKGTSNVLLTKKEDEQKKYSLIVQDGERLFYCEELIMKNKYLFVSGTSTILTINLDESVEIIRSGSMGVVISLPKQKNLSYLLKFSNQEGILIFNTFEKIKNLILRRERKMSPMH